MPESQIKVAPVPGQPWGTDLCAVNAARRSFGGESSYEEMSDGRWVLPEKDKRLLGFLARGMTTNDLADFSEDIARKGYNTEVLYETDEKASDIEFQMLMEDLWKWRDTPEHDTPFNHMFMSFNIEAPVFVARQLVKHEYLPWSEYSRRYKTEDIEFYSPDVWRSKSEDIKQGSSNQGINNSEYNPQYLDDKVKYSYLEALDQGVCPEQARMLLPQSTMTSWTWSGSFGAFAKMLRLRLAEDTQYETRLVAQKIAEYSKEWFPESHKVLVERNFK